MSLSLFEQCRLRRMRTQLFLTLFSIAALYAVVCTPIYLWSVSDILIMQTVFPMIWDVVMLVLNYLFYWCAFVTVLYAFYRFGSSMLLSYLGIYGGVVVFRYVANLLAGYFVNSFPVWEDFVSDTLPYLLIDIGMDCVLMAIFLWILIACKNKNLTATNQNSSTLLLKNLPFDALFRFRNPIGRVALYGAIIPAAVQLLSRIVYDFYLGAPTDMTDLLWMVIYYLSDIANILIGYLVMALFLNQFYMSEEKARLEDQSLFPEEASTK